MPPRTDNADFMGLLPQECAAGLKRLELLARRSKEGSVGGRHASPHKGFSVEFNEHREYAPGDDVRTLDWRIFARKDRHYVRQYSEETNLRCSLLLDASASMRYAGTASQRIGGQPVSKFEYARYLAAAFAHLVMGQRDAAGLVTFDSQVRQHLRATSRPSQLRQILRALHATSPGGETQIAPVLHRIAERIPPRGLVVLISDLFDDPDSLSPALHRLAARSHELLVIHVMADEELRFPFERFEDFHDLENDAVRVRVDPAAVRVEYLKRVQSFVSEIAGTCAKLQADYLPANTSEPYTEVLAEYLRRR